MASLLKGTSGLILFYCSTLPTIISASTVVIKNTYISPSDERHNIISTGVNAITPKSYQDVPSHLPTHVLSFSAVHIQNLSPSEASLKIRRCPEKERNRSHGRNPCIVNISPWNFLLLDGLVTVPDRLMEKHITFMLHCLSLVMFKTLQRGLQFPPRHSFQFVPWIPWMKSEVNVSLIHEMLRLHVSGITFLAWQPP